MLGVEGIKETKALSNSLKEYSRLFVIQLTFRMSRIQKNIEINQTYKTEN